MKSEASMQKLLVIVDSDLIEAVEPMEAALLKRAASIARDTGCEIELFHVAYDSALDYQLFSSADELQEQRRQILDRDATRLAGIAALMLQNGIKATHDARWDFPRADAILRKVARSKPDLVMKRQKEHSFLFGITTNTEWELARRAPANVWLVHDSVDRIDTLVAAVGNRSALSRDSTDAMDRRVLKTAAAVGDACDARLLAVNAYRALDGLNFAAAVGGPVMPIDSATNVDGGRSRIVATHRADVEALTDSFGIAASDVYVREGDPATVIPDVASEVDASLIVMGASSIGRLERVMRSVTVEPVMANTTCDILIVREPDDQTLADLEQRPVAAGIPKYDLENAITDPDTTFDSPQEVANLSDVSIELRTRILQAWEYDIRAEMSEENEGGPVREIDINALDEILAAKELLKMKARRAEESRESAERRSH